MKPHAALRRAINKDAVAVRTLTRLAYAKWVPLLGREPLPMIADHDAAIKAHLVDLLEVGDELVALIEMIPEQHSLLIENLAVAPPHQGKGYARSLLAHAAQTASQLGLSETRLYTNRLFTSNVALYSQFGYLVDRVETFAGGHVIYMSKPISVA